MAGGHTGSRRVGRACCHTPSKIVCNPEQQPWGHPARGLGLQRQPKAAAVVAPHEGVVVGVGGAHMLLQRLLAAPVAGHAILGVVDTAALQQRGWRRGAECWAVRGCCWVLDAERQRTCGGHGHGCVHTQSRPQVEGSMPS